MEAKDTVMSAKKIAGICDRDVIINEDWTDTLLPWYKSIAEAQASISFKAGFEQAFKEMLMLPEDMKVYKSENIVDEESFKAGVEEGWKQAEAHYQIDTG